MGYWKQNMIGTSFADNDGEEMIWGDAPADAIGDALDAIVRVFREDVGRAPTKSEVLAGLLFSLRARDELPDGESWPLADPPEPEGDPMDRFLSRAAGIIERVGWLVQVVAPDPGTDDHMWSYTVGLTAKEHPEFAIAVPLAPETAQAILNGLGQRVMDGERFESGQVLDDVLVGFNVHLAAVVTDDEDHPFGVARALYPDRPVRGLQVVFPDRFGRFPGEDDYSFPPQRLLPVA